MPSVWKSKGNFPFLFACCFMCNSFYFVAKSAPSSSHGFQWDIWIMIYKRFPFFFLPLFFHLLHPYPHLRSAASVVALVKPFTTSWYVYNIYMSLCVYVRSFTHSFSHLFNIFQQADEKLFNYWLFPESINRSNRCLYCYTECCSFECNKFHFTMRRNEKKK